jgi:hypothetical protein
MHYLHENGLIVKDNKEEQMNAEECNRRGQGSRVSGARQTNKQADVRRRMTLTADSPSGGLTASHSPSQTHSRHLIIG